MEKEVLLKTTWDDKKGRYIGGPSPYELFIALKSPEPKLAEITANILDTLAQNKSIAETWARCWGQVCICVGPKNRPSVLLSEVKADQNRNYIPVSSTRLISPQKFIGEMPGGDLATILINSKPTTIEAFMISYVHMLDELIWDVYRKKLSEFDSKGSDTIYQKALGEVTSRGFNIKVASEDEILSLKLNNPNVSIRLYGSGVNKQIEKVMGAVVFSGVETGRKHDFMTMLQSLKGTLNELVDLEEQKKIEQLSTKTRTLVITSVTMGKEIHAGHILLMTVADLIKRGLESKDPIALINNNTGPRAAGTLVNLSKQLSLGLKETAEVLTRDIMPCDRIVEAYRLREENSDIVGEAHKLLDQGGYDIFACLARRVARRLDAAGFDVRIVTESANLSVQNELLEKANPVWNDSGFCFVQGEKNLRVLQKGGSLTATGKSVTSMMSLARQAIGQNESPTLIFVDSSADAIDAVASFNSLSLGGRAFQLAGAGIGFRGEIASGSRGEALTVSDLLDEFSNRCPGDRLSSSLGQLILTRPLFVPNIKSPNLSLSFYDYRDNQSFVSDLVKCVIEANDFKTQIDQVIENLRSKVARSSQTEDNKVKKFLEFLPRRLQWLVEMSAEDIVTATSKVRALRTSGEYNKIEYGLSRFMSKPEARKLLIKTLSTGVWSANQLADIARNEVKFMPTPLFGKDFQVRDEIIEAVINQGYEGEELAGRVKLYMEGTQGLAIRENPYLKTIKTIMETEYQTASLSVVDFTMMEKSILICRNRLGYE